jgi:hypothetical protein
MKKTAKELVEAFNKLRLQHANEQIVGTQLTKELSAVGFNGDIIALLKKNPELFSTKRAFSGPKMFSFKENPLYIGQLTAIMQSTKKPKGSFVKEKQPLFTEKEAIEFLKNRGFRIQKEVGLNIEAIRKDNPSIYEKYLILEEV